MSNFPANLIEPAIKTHTASDGYQWSYRHYQVANPKARLVFLHGIQSHGGWYLRSNDSLANAGYEVYFLERRGCGLNTQARGDIPSFRRCLDDIGEFIKTIPRDKPIVLGAISWGGKLAAALPYRHPGLIDGLMLYCPGLFPVVRPGFFQRLWIGRCAIRKPTKLFPIPLNDPELFTQSPQWIDFLRQDPLALREATARMLFQSSMLDFYLKRAKRRINCPLLLMLGEKDRIINNQKTAAYINSIPGTKTIITYPGAQHTLEFEPTDLTHTTRTIEWLNNLPIQPNNT